MCESRNPLFCILPPYILEEVAAHGTPAQQEQARETMVSGDRIRAQRQMITELSVQPSTVTTELERIVFDAQNGSVLPGRQVRAEGEPPTGDPAADEAYDGAGATYALYKEVYGRNSIDDRGMRLESTVHYRVGYDNAFWNGQRMVYGDGDEDLPEDERLFNRFTIAIDIIGHELTHGVTQFSAGLVYRDQPGALNESMSDVFGSLVKQRTLGQEAAEADWIIGAGLFSPNVNGVGIRSMKAPGTAYNDPILGQDPQPGHMDDYVQTQSDNGGVHLNSGIPNRAFYLTAVEIGGNAWDKAGRIWYVTLRDKLSSSSNFFDAARFTYATAGELYGRGSREQQAVRAGWSGVGIIISEDDAGDGDGGEQPSGCLSSLMGLAFLRSLWERK